MSDDCKNMAVAKQIVDLVNKRKLDYGPNDSFSGFTAEQDEAGLVCAPAPLAMAGSVQRLYDLCGCIVWLSPEGQASVHARGERKTTLICMTCFHKTNPELMESK